MKRVFFGYLGIFALGISFLTAYAPFEREPGLSNQRGVQEIGLSVPDTILEDRGWQDVNEATLGADLIAGAYWTPTVDFSGGTKYYFDPTATTKGTGTADSPFRALGVEVASDSTILHRDAGGDTTNLANGPVVGDGDICVLMPGNHGNILFDSFYFDDWLAVVGVPSGGALFDSLGLATVEKVYFDNVYANRRTRQQWAAPGTGATDVPIQAALDSVDRIIFNNCRFGVEDPAVIAATWSDSATFNLNAVHGIASAGTAPSSRLHVQNSEFYGVAGGVRVYYLGDVANIIGNTVQYATRTGLLVGSADSVTISQNTSLDLIRSDPAGHGNGIAVNHSNTSGTSSYGLIEKNFIATSTDVTRGFGYRDASNGVGIGISFTNPADAADVHDNWTVQNNIVVHQGWGGIQMYDATNTSIINNTLVAQSDSSSWLTNSNSWPQVKFSGALTASVVAANNICGTVYWDDGADAGEVTESNNLETQILSGSGNELDFGVFDFVSWSGATGAAVNIDPRTYDLHLDAYSPAIRAGSSTYAPATDYAGDTRPDKVYDDIGAYVYDDPDVTAPLAIDYLGVTNYYDQIDLSWPAVAASDLDYYNLYRDSAGKDIGSPLIDENDLFDTIAGGTETYTDTNVSTAGDSTYFYRVAAVDSSGNVATLGYAASATPTADPMYWSAFSATTPTIADTTSGGNAEMTTTAILQPRAGFIRPLFRRHDAAYDSSGMAWLPLSDAGDSARYIWSGAYDTGVPIANASTDSGGIRLDWDAATGHDGYILDMNVSTDGSTWGGWNLVTYPAPTDTAFIHAADDDTLAPRRGILNYRLYAFTGTPGAETDSSAVALLDSEFYNQSVGVYTRFHAVEDTAAYYAGTETPEVSSEVLGVWVSQPAEVGDTAPPDTTDVLADVPIFAIAWGDTTNTNAHLTATVDASASDEPLMAFSQIKVAYDGSWTPADTTGNWWPATATGASFVDTVYSGATMAAVAADTIYWRTQLRDMQSTPNVSAFIGANDGDWRWDTLARASAASSDTVGYGSIGANTMSAYEDAISARIVMTEDGSITSGTFYLDAASAGDSLKIALYDASYNLLEEGRGVTATGDAAWVTVDLDSPYSASNSTAYYITVFGQDYDLLYYYDSEYTPGINKVWLDSDVTWANFPEDPISPNTLNEYRRASAYVTYTP